MGYVAAWRCHGCRPWCGGLQPGADGWPARGRPAQGVLGLQPGWNRQGCSLLRVGVRWPHLDSAEHADRDETQHVLRPECHLRAKQSDGRAEPGPPPRAAATAAVVVSWPPRADVP
eukprot:scaffold23729_cov23-Phaeocystis_antarctica.AAC.1